MRYNRAGFTLVELLVVVVIIGILAAIAIPKFANTKEKAYVASMKADLRRLLTEQERYLAEFMTYTPSKAALNYQESEGVVVTIQGATQTGFGASATHPGTTLTCAIYYGNGPVVAPATGEGEVACQ